jgi:hypothetical protein
MPLDATRYALSALSPIDDIGRPHSILPDKFLTVRLYRASSADPTRCGCMQPARICPHSTLCGGAFCWRRSLVINNY